MKTAQFIDQFGGRVIAFNPFFADIGGGAIPGLFLSQAFYWQKINGPGEWWWKTGADWTEETRLTRREQERARRKLKAVGVLEEECRGSPATMHYKVRIDKVMCALGIRCDDPEEDLSPEEFSLADPYKLDCTDPPNLNGGSVQTHLHHKSTSESTPESLSSLRSDGRDFAPGEAGEEISPPESEEELPAEILAAASAGLEFSRLTEEDRRAQPDAKRIEREGGDVGRRRRSKSEAKLQNEQAAADHRLSAAEGVLVDQRPHPSTWKPESSSSFSEWSDWAAGWITNSKKDERKTNRRNRPPEAWNGADLNIYLGHLVCGFMGQRAPIVKAKTRGQATNLIAQVGGDEAKAMIDYAVEHWTTLASVFDIDAPKPRLGIIVGFADEIMGLMEGKGGKVGGSHRDRTKWVDDDNVVGWGADDDDADDDS